MFCFSDFQLDVKLLDFLKILVLNLKTFPTWRKNSVWDYTWKWYFVMILVFGNGCRVRSIISETSSDSVLNRASNNSKIDRLLYSIGIAFSALKG